MAYTKIEQTDFSQFYQAVLEENYPAMEAFMKRQLSESISYYDSAENFYHGYLVGVLSGLEGYALDSNKEHGNGRPDILLTPFDPERPAVIMEVKMAERFSQMEKLCKLALAQIDERVYALELEAEGYKVIRKCGVCFCKKNCVVRM